MLGADDDHQLVARHRLADENWIIDLSLDKAKIRFAAANRSRRLACVDHRQPDRDARMGATEGGEMTRQPIASDRLAGMNGEDAAFEIAQFERTSSADSARAKTARASAKNKAPASVSSM